MRNKLLRISMLFLSVWCLLTADTFGQESLQNAWQQVLKNNKKIASGLALVESQKLQAKVGITPDDPELEYGYFPGNTDAIGTKQVFSVSQRIAPASFWYKRKVAKTEIGMLDLDKQLLIQEVMLETWETWCRAVYLNQMAAIMQRREENASKVLESMQSKQLTGAATQLEVNKAKLFHMEIANQARLMEGETRRVSKKLQALNGGLDLEIQDSSFQFLPLSTWAEIKNEIDTSHLVLEKLARNKDLAKNQIKLSKSAWIPNLMLGYESEDIQGDKFSGVKAGVSIPLWNNKHAVGQSKAQLAYAKALEEDETLNILADYEQRYIATNVLYSNVLEFKQQLNEMNNISLLNRSFVLGQISAIDYFRELNYFYEISDQLINLELLYQFSLAKLYEYRL